jgi:hypothetical protein
MTCVEFMTFKRELYGKELNTRIRLNKLSAGLGTEKILDFKRIYIISIHNLDKGLKNNVIATMQYSHVC